MFANLPPLTRTLILCNVMGFLAQVIFGGVLIAHFGLWPIAAHGGAAYPTFALWQLVTYSFLHGGISHLLFNMFALYMFGGELERFFGTRRFFSLYFAGVIAAALAQLVFTSAAGGTPHPTIGASGGIFGLLLAYGLFFPRRIIVLLIPPIPMPAWLFVTIYGALELFLGVSGSQEGVAHFAHLGGMLGAWLMIHHWMKRR